MELLLLIIISQDIIIYLFYTVLIVESYFICLFFEGRILLIDLSSFLLISYMIDLGCPIFRLDFVTN